MRSEYIFPTVLIALDVCASVPYAAKCNWRMTIYWMAAATREALSDACYAMFNFLKTQNGGWEEMANALDKSKAALADPPRNCDACNTVDDAVARAIHLGVVDCGFGAREMAEFLLAEAKGEAK